MACFELNFEYPFVFVVSIMKFVLLLSFIWFVGSLMEPGYEAK